MSEVKGETGSLSAPALLVHGGAGSFAGVTTAEAAGLLERALAAALAAGWAVLGAGHAPPDGPDRPDRPVAPDASRGADPDPLEAAVAAVVALEDSGVFNAGRGAVPTADGKTEYDASVMDSTGRVGAVAATRYPANPVLAARLVAEHGGLPDGPLLLAGRGADRFARAAGLAKASTRSGEATETGAGSPHGTVGAVALGHDGRLAAATSTGGRPGQWRGRVGDTPIVGAGVWADPATVAVSATGAGEAFVVVGFAHRVDWLLREGHPLYVAVDDSLGLVAARGGEGGAIALRPDGSFAARFTTRAMARGWRDRNGAATRLLAP